MEIKHETTDTKGVFYILSETGEHSRVGEMTYSKWGDSKMIIDHTEVSHKLRGEGAGKKLVHAAVDFARANDKKILALCPFAKSVLDKMGDVGDVMA